MSEQNQISNTISSTPFPILNRKDIKVEGVLLTPDDLNMLISIVNRATENAQNLEVNYQDVSRFDNEMHLRDELKQFFRVTFRLTHEKINVKEGYEYIDFQMMGVPKNIDGIFISNRESFNKRAHGDNPANCVDIFLDFTKPSLALNFFNLPSNPTTNGSVINIYGYDVTWVDALYQNLTDFFESKRQRITFLHRSGVYDFFLFLIVAPVFIFYSYRIEKSELIDFSEISTTIQIAIYLYAVLFVINFARAVFLYFRWLFPLVEYSPPQRGSLPSLHRGIFLFLLATMSGGLAYDSVIWIIKSSTTGFG